MTQLCLLYAHNTVHILYAHNTVHILYAHKTVHILYAHNTVHILITYLLFPLYKKSTDKIFGILRNCIECFIIEVIVCSSDIGKCFSIVVTHEWRQSRQPA